jgi:hypothetical protein
MNEPKNYQEVNIIELIDNINNLQKNLIDMLHQTQLIKEQLKLKRK